MSKATEAAARLGALAAQLGKPLTDCPYDPAGPPQQRAGASAWVRAYRHWRPTRAVNYGGDDGPMGS